MPENAVAIVMDAAGEGRLTCRAQNSGFRIGDKVVVRGVVSYHAARTLADAESVADWAARMNEGLARDRGIPVEVTGRATILLPGLSIR